MNAGWYKLFFTVAVLIVCVGIGSVQAQIPNASFENWTNGNPDNWNTSNDTSLGINVTQVSDAHAGASAMMGSVINSSGFLWPPLVIAGADGGGFPVSTQHPALHGWYKYFPNGGDEAFLTIDMLSGDSSVGAAAILASDSESVYREFVVNIIYLYPQAPETCIIAMTILSTSGPLHLGSRWIVDDLSFGATTSVDGHGNVLPSSFELSQNFPNPFNPKTMIQYSIPNSSRVRLGVYDIFGKEVANLVDQHQEPGNYRAEFDATNLASGVYFYRLQAGQFSQMKKLLLVR